MRAFCVVLVFSLASCSWADKVKEPRVGLAFISIPLSSGYPTVRISSLRRPWSPITLHLYNNYSNCSDSCGDSYTFQPGTYIAEVTCNRSLKEMVIAPDRDVGHLLRFSVLPNQNYTLDCEERTDGSLRFWVAAQAGNAPDTTP